YNRLVLFRPWYWHSHGENFGTTLEDTRLVQLFFFREGETLNLTSDEFHKRLRPNNPEKAPMINVGGIDPVSNAINTFKDHRANPPALKPGGLPPEIGNVMPIETIEYFFNKDK